MDLSEHAARNREVWNEDAPQWVESGREAWASPAPWWGMWHVPEEDVGGASDAGAVNVLFGSAAGLTAAGSQIWHQDSAGVPGAGLFRMT